MSRLTRAAAMLGVIVAAVIATGSTAWAEEPTQFCIPEKPTKPLESVNAKGECTVKGTTTYKLVTLPGTAELQTLDKILPFISFNEAGVGGKPTVRFSGVNVQIVSGSGSTKGAVNGAGNLVIGYDEKTAENTQTGSHDLVLGEDQSFTSYGSIVAGKSSTASAPYASVTGGTGNTASEVGTSVTGGRFNTASGLEASVTGGQENRAKGTLDAITGGEENRTEGNANAIHGGALNVIESDTQDETILGGSSNKVPFSSFYNVIAGGEENTFGKEAFASAILGGHKQSLNGSYLHFP
jgi:hypothetical protein